MTDEKNLVEMTIRVDLSTGCTLDHVCAKCGTEAKSVPACLERYDRATGRTLPDDVFVVRSAAPPAGWEHMRITYAGGEGTKHVEVCPECIREFFRWLEPK